MPFDRSALLLAWFAGGFILFLLWAALVGQALLGTRRAAVRPAIGVLLLLGLVHPVAAISAADLARLARSIDHPDLHLPAWLPPVAVALAGASTALALVAWTQVPGS